jgi:hypothetical protein
MENPLKVPIKPLVSPLQASVMPPVSNNKKNKKKNKKENKKEASFISPILSSIIKGLKPNDNEEGVYKDNFLNLLPDSFINKEFLSAWFDWIDYRFAIKKKLIEASAKEQINFLIQQPSPVNVIRESIKNQWQGLFKEKIQYGNSRNSNGATDDQLARLATQHYFEQAGRE